ncbi:MAG: SPOR domain-containing protein [Calditrichaeota bacterium]|nr:MAG: SPOR domain-containing protein [Calditrichota bacterium]MBL1205657.1 SPOR domain-containing protein [Calditrichota bacterium]NOG45485.1 SPOR domain-containing protein [Calditrichota bacterium]
MIHQKVLLFLTALFIMVACNPQGIRRSRLQGNQTEAQPDSFLYYQPMAINDPFLDSLKSGNDKEESVKVRLIPPPPPQPPTTKQVEGFRIQTFAGLDSVNALASIEKLKTMVNDSIYFFKDKGLHKIQFGDFIYRNDADLKVLDIRKFGISGAWVVATLVNVPVDTSSKQADVDSVGQQPDAPFKIQVLVTSDFLKAQSLIVKLQAQFNQESYFSSTDKLHKIYLGKFTNRSEAEKVLDQVKKSGYPDAWLVYKKL